MKKYSRANRAYFVWAFICVLIATLFGVALQFIKGEVLDEAIGGDAAATLRLALLLFGFILCECLFFFLYQRLAAKYSISCVRLLKRDIFDGILRRSYTQYKQRPQGEYIATYTAEADSIKERRFDMQPLLVEILIKIALVTVALFLLDWRIALITIALLTTPLYLPKLIEKRLRRAQTERLKAVDDNLTKINDWLSGFELIKNFSIERSVLARFRTSNDDVMKKLENDAMLGITAQLITTLISYLSYFAVLACAAWLVISGDFSAGDFFVAIGMIDQLSWPLISLSRIIRMLVAVKPTCDKTEQFLAEPDDTSAGGKLVRLKSGIRFKNVSFAYDGGQPLLDGVSMDIRSGMKCLLKGPSGCGKTTAVNLLLRYHSAASGSIEVDGVPIEQYSDAYGCVTVVRQDAILFGDTLRNNLSLYADIPDASLIKTLCALGLERYATAEALDGAVSEGGANLSGGERKRICIARALLRDTDVLVFDEPLANLDDANASKIEDILLSIPERTVIVVSHSFSPEKLSRFDLVYDFAAHACRREPAM